ncbi:MAG: hypothetical protein ACRYFS_21515 [Janthinobacterium lividum]
MKPITINRLVTWLWLLLLCTICSLGVVSPLRAFVTLLTDPQAKEVAHLRAAGITADRTQIPALVQELKAPIHRDALKASLLSLAQMGAVEALPEVNALCLNTADPAIQAYAQAAKARLLAENTARSASSPQSEASTKITAFYQALDTTPEHLNAVTAKSKVGAALEQPLEVYAIRQIADMVYWGNYADYASLPGVSQVDFQNDYPASLKMRLAAVEPSQRLNVMLKEMAQRVRWQEGGNFEIQLAADKSLTSDQAAADQITFMAANRKDYPEYGFQALFQILECVGDKNQTKLLKPFLDDKNGGIAQSAQSAYYYSVWGLQRQRAIGY